MTIEITKLDENLSVTGQICIDDIDQIASSGFRSIICNRPDYEGGNEQPTSEELEIVANQSASPSFTYLFESVP